MSDALSALVASDAVARCLSPEGLHPAVRAAVERSSAYFAPQPTDLRLRSLAYQRVLDAVLCEDLCESDLAGTTGYGYNDASRERYESALARIYRAERALARLSIVSGTHAIMLALAAVAPPGMLLLSATGRPYDTLANAIAQAPGSLVDQGVFYDEVPLSAAGLPQIPLLAKMLQKRDTRPLAAVFIQRSRGYAPRPSLAIADIAEIVQCVKTHAPQAVVVVDNCYCELVEEQEPLEVGADLVMGSLIKNLGGSIAPGGGYIAGRADLIERVTHRLYAPGLGDALGPTFGFGRLFFQGLMLAPQIIWESLRGLRFAAALFTELGFAVDPLPDAARRDIVQALRFGDRRKVETAAKALQRVMPLNRRFAPEPGAVPGYVDQVIMSSGAFVGGATIELSCDAPLRAPYELYLQGGTSAEHVVIGALVAADALLRIPS